MAELAPALRADESKPLASARAPGCATRRVRAAAACVPALVLYLLCSWCAISTSFTDDETWEFFASKSLAETGTPLRVTGETNSLHPHLYYHVLARFLGWFGADETGARLLGIAATLLAAAALLRILYRVTGRLDALSCFLATSFYLLAPVVIQGALVITADTALQHLSATAIILYMVERQRLRAADFAVLAVLFALAFWIKLVTPCVLLFGIALHFAARRDWRLAARVALFAGGGGFLLFLATWSAYCAASGIDSMAVFSYFAAAVASRGAAESFAAKGLLLARMSLTVLLWVGIPCALLAFRAIADHRRLAAGTSPAIGLLLVTGSVFAVVFTVAGGVAFGYPRYHFPMFPIWAVVLAAYAGAAIREARLPARGYIAAGAATFFFALFAAGDPLYALTFELKVAMLADPALPAAPISALACTILFAFVPAGALLAAARLLGSPARTTALIACAAIAGNLALAGVQARADYHTAHAYGESGSEAVHEHCRVRLMPGRLVVGGKDVVYHTTGEGYMDDWRWNDKGYLLARLADERTQFFVMGIQHNTIEQLRRVREDADLRGLLDAEYRRTRIGSYIIWERAHRGAAPTAEIAR